MFRINRLPVVMFTALLAVCAPDAFAQTDFSGEWSAMRSHDNTENPAVGDFVGLPFNSAGMLRGESWDPALLSLPEYQCRPHGWAYIYRGPTQLRISKEIDESNRDLVAYQPEWHQSTNSPVYLDGRSRPPEEAAHTWGGFSTGTWEGDILRIETTHLKEDYIRRNGAMMSDEAEVTTWWMRRGDYLTWVTIIHDPLYLSEPLIRSAEYKLNVNAQVPAHPCTSIFEGLPKGAVPHYLPGENPFLKELHPRYGLPADSPTGGPETMYPEFRKRMGESTFSKGVRQAQPDNDIPQRPNELSPREERR